MASKENQEVLSKQGEFIQKGDHVYTKIRSGRHEGDVSSPLSPQYCVSCPIAVADFPTSSQVEKIVTSEKEAQRKGVKNPPKVLFTDQRGKDVAHNPGTLDKVEN